MVEYTVILLYSWSKHSDTIKSLFHNNDLLLNSTKTLKLTNDELKLEYTKFKVDEYFDTNLSGLSGYYELEDKSIIIKIIKNDNVDNIILVYRGIKDDFYKEFIVTCRDIGSLVIVIEDDEIVFKNRINVELIKILNDIQNEHKIKIKNFIEKTNLLESLGFLYSNDFKEQWIECIENDTN